MQHHGTRSMTREAGTRHGNLVYPVGVRPRESLYFAE